MSSETIVHLVDSVLDLKGNPPQSLFLVNGYVATKTVDKRFVQNYMNNQSGVKPIRVVIRRAVSSLKTPTVKIRQFFYILHNFSGRMWYLTLLNKK